MRRLDLKISKHFKSLNRINDEGGSEIALVVQNLLDDTSYTDYNPAAHSRIRNYFMAKFEF